MHDIMPGYAGRQEEHKDIVIAVGSAGGGAVLAAAVISAAVTCAVCLVLKKRTNKNGGLSDQTSDYTSNGRVLEQIHDVGVTDNNPAYNVSATTTSHELEVVYYDAISQAGRVTAELPRDSDSDRDTLEENLAYESSALQTIAENQYGNI